MLYQISKYNLLLSIITCLINDFLINILNEKRLVWENGVKYSSIGIGIGNRIERVRHGDGDGGGDAITTN